jgi:hypothetical protein
MIITPGERACLSDDIVGSLASWSLQNVAGNQRINLIKDGNFGCPIHGSQTVLELIMDDSLHAGVLPLEFLLGL